jgi:hypothetical protein
VGEGVEMKCKKCGCDRDRHEIEQPYPCYDCECKSFSYVAEKGENRLVQRSYGGKSWGKGDTMNLLAEVYRGYYIRSNFRDEIWIEKDTTLIGWAKSLDDAKKIINSLVEEQGKSG